MARKQNDYLEEIRLGLEDYLEEKLLSEEEDMDYFYECLNRHIENERKALNEFLRDGFFSS